MELATHLQRQLRELQGRPLKPVSVNHIHALHGALFLSKSATDALSAMLSNTVHDTSCTLSLSNFVHRVLHDAVIAALREPHTSVPRRNQVRLASTTDPHSHAVLLDDTTTGLQDARRLITVSANERLRCFTKPAFTGSHISATSSKTCLSEPSSRADYRSDRQAEREWIAKRVLD
jgi:hypothetical protein